jgi:phage gpG-like protein
MERVDMQGVIRNILRDLRVELTDEFDKNFERQAFFSEAWQRRRSPLRPGGTTLMNTGALRRSIGSREEGDSIIFSSTLPYAAIHNEGGDIEVTARMKRYFWAKYYETAGTFGRRKDGTKRRDRQTQQLTTEAEFWRCMALMKVGSKIRIPKRTFVGYAPEVERSVREIIEENLTEYFNSIKLQ